MSNFFFALTIIFSISLISSAAPVIAKWDTEKSPNIQYGCGVIQSCKCVTLSTDFESNGDKLTSSVTSESPCFNEVQQWLFKNVLPSLNDFGSEGSEADDRLLLTTLKVHGLQDILLGMRLNRATLGPDYKNKISELRQIMHHPQKSPAEQLDDSGKLP